MPGQGDVGDEGPIFQGKARLLQGTAGPGGQRLQGRTGGRARPPGIAEAAQALRREKKAPAARKRLQRRTGRVLPLRLAQERQRQMEAGRVGERAPLGLLQHLPAQSLRPHRHKQPHGVSLLFSDFHCILSYHSATIVANV